MMNLNLYLPSATSVLNTDFTKHTAPRVYTRTGTVACACSNAVPATATATATVDAKAAKKAEKEARKAKKAERSAELLESLKTEANVSEEIWADWREVCKAKKKEKITRTTLKKFREEAAKAGISVGEAVTICAQRGWASFGAGWIQPDMLTKPKAQATSFDAAADDDFVPLF